jgi:hypothetical protein
VSRLASATRHERTRGPWIAVSAGCGVPGRRLPGGARRRAHAHRHAVQGQRVAAADYESKGDWRRAARGQATRAGASGLLLGPFGANFGVNFGANVDARSATLVHEGA